MTISAGENAENPFSLMIKPPGHLPLADLFLKLRNQSDIFC